MSNSWTGVSRCFDHEDLTFDPMYYISMWLSYSCLNLNNYALCWDDLTDSKDLTNGFETGGKIVFLALLFGSGIIGFKLVSEPLNASTLAPERLNTRTPQHLNIPQLSSLNFITRYYFSTTPQHLNLTKHLSPLLPCMWCHQILADVKTRCQAQMGYHMSPEQRKEINIRKRERAREKRAEEKAMKASEEDESQAFKHRHRAFKLTDIWRFTHTDIKIRILSSRRLELIYDLTRCIHVEICRFC